MKIEKRTKFRLALLALACGNAVAFAGDGFIVQPKLRQAARETKAAAASTVAPMANAKSGVQSPPLAQPVGKTKAFSSGTETVSILERTETPTRAVTSPSLNATKRTPPAAPHFAPIGSRQAKNDRLTNDNRLASSGARASTATRTDTGTRTNIGSRELQWVSRGASLNPPPRAMTGNHQAPTQPLEFENPEFEYQVAQHPSANSATTPSKVPSTAFAAQSQETQRSVIASLISSKIIGDAESNEGGKTISRVDSSPGWQAVGERLWRQLRDCETHLKHAAFFSAREEAEQAAVYLMRVLDLESNSYSSEPFWNSAMLALRESEDFTFALRTSGDVNVLKRIVDSHQTEALKNTDTRNVSPLVAAQHYQQFAEKNLIAASQGHPWASEVFYSMGRTYQAQADTDEQAQDVLRRKAITFYRAALAVSPRNSIAANQLGFILLQMDRAQDARGILLGSLKAEVSAPALENLVEASRRLGDLQTHQWAMEHLAIYRQLNPPQIPVPVVTEIDAAAFMAISPRNIGPQPQSNTTSRIAAGYSESAAPGAVLR